MKTRIFNLIILDESGSMQSIKNAAINNVNETIQTIRVGQEENPDQEHFVSFVSFNGAHVNTVYDCVAAVEVPELTADKYCPNCSTPLYDAMGSSLNALRPKVADADRVLVTIVTDGYENSSREYNGKAIKALVEELKGKGWVFVYVGANQDVEKVAESMAIHNSMSFCATEYGVECMTKEVNDSRKRLFSRISKDDFNAAEENSSFFSK